MNHPLLSFLYFRVQYVTHMDLRVLNTALTNEQTLNVKSISRLLAVIFQHFVPSQIQYFRCLL